MTAAAETQISHHMPSGVPAPKLVDPEKLTPFVDRLPLPAVAKSVGYCPVPGKHGEQAPLFRVPIAEFQAKVHRDISPTRFWGYGGSVPGVTIEARKGQRIAIDWPNELPTKHFLPVDRHLMGAQASNPEVRTVVHVHGAKAPPESDGFPEDWYVPGQSRIYHYPNEQDAALLWYHDHAMGINRLNIMAGLAGLYIVRDEQEDALNLPKGQYEIPLVLMDRMIRLDGQLYYPVSQRPEAP